MLLNYRHDEEQPVPIFLIRHLTGFNEIYCAYE